jgi:hypothetical protein
MAAIRDPKDPTGDIISMLLVLSKIFLVKIQAAKLT